MTDNNETNPQRVEAEAQVSWLAQLLERAKATDHEMQQLVQASNRALAAVQSAQGTAERAQQSAESGAEKVKHALSVAEGAQQAATASRDAAVQAKASAESSSASAAEVLSALTALKTTAAEHHAAVVAAKDAAAQACLKASESQKATETARDTAETAQEATTAASNETEAARDSAKASLEDTLATQVKADAARNAIAAIEIAAKKTVEDLTTALTAAEKQRDGADAARKAALEFRVAAELEANQAAEAHNLSTTAGLAGAFNLKAQGTKGRERFWGIALVASLIAVAAIGWTRYSDLKELLQSKPDTWTIAAQFLLTIFGVGAPVWLAWMSTRMISKNFALTEDYAYKASLAQAYVGFRKEAKGLDPLLEQRLFAAAITQLDANPVRFLDASHPGSPLQDLLQQPFMRDLLQDPSVKQKFVEWLKSRFNAKLSVPDSASANVTPISAATSAQKAGEG